MLLTITAFNQTGTIKGAITDEKGNYAINAVEEGAAAIYGNGGFINYITKTTSKHTPITRSLNVWTTSN